MTGILFFHRFFFAYTYGILHCTVLQCPEREIDREALTPMAFWRSRLRLFLLFFVRLRPVDIKCFHYDMLSLHVFFGYIHTTVKQHIGVFNSISCFRIYYSLMLNHFVFVFFSHILPLVILSKVFVVFNNLVANVTRTRFLVLSHTDLTVVDCKLCVS